jgi:hypothetical protein
LENNGLSIPDELLGLIFHFGTSSWGGTRKATRAFTEQGVAILKEGMLAVLGTIKYYLMVHRELSYRVSLPLKQFVCLGR